MPLPFIEDQGRQVVPASYFFNNDLEYLKGRSLSSKYTTSITKTKAAKYDTIEGIEDMVPSLWSPVKDKKWRVKIKGLGLQGDLMAKIAFGTHSHKKHTSEALTKQAHIYEDLEPSLTYYK
ncbi:hypothetical protein Tco_0120784 [Tanacetum coccineum]